MIIQQLKLFNIACTTSTGNEFGDRGATSLSEALKVNTTITKLNLSCENRRHIIIFINNSLFFSSHQQSTILETQEQYHWVKHWNPTKRSQNSILAVTQKQESSPLVSKWIDYLSQFHCNRQLFSWHGNESVEWSIKNEHCAYCTMFRG